MALMTSSVLGELRSSLYVPATASATPLSSQLPRRSSTHMRHTVTGTGTGCSGAATSARRKTARGSVTERDLERPPRPRPRADSLSAAFHHHCIGLPGQSQPQPLHVLLSTGQALAAPAAAERSTGTRGHSRHSFVRAVSYSSPASEPLAGATMAARGEFTFVDPLTLANIALGSVLPRDSHPGASAFASGVACGLGVSPLSPPPERVFLFPPHSHVELRRQSRGDRDRRARDTGVDNDDDDGVRSPTRSTSHTPSPGHTPLQNAPLACVPQVCTNHTGSVV